MSENLIDLVAVAYNAPDELTHFLESVLSSVSFPFTFRLIDNNSPDQTVRDIMFEYEEAMYSNPFCVKSEFIRSYENQGYARAINQGISLGSAPYAAALNCDIEFYPGVVNSIVKAFQRPDYDKVAVIGPKTVDRMNRLTHGGIFNHGVNDQHRAWQQVDRPGLADDVVDVPTVSGATYFMRRDIWNELAHCPLYRGVAPDATGAFLPTRHFYEETWYSYHARAHGYTVKYHGDIKMMHSWHKSSPIGSISLSEAEIYFRRAAAAHQIELSW